MKTKRAVKAQVQPVVMPSFIPYGQLEINSNDQALLDNLKRFNKLFIESFSIPYELIQPDIKTATEILFKMKYRI